MNGNTPRTPTGPDTSHSGENRKRLTAVDLEPNKMRAILEFPMIQEQRMVQKDANAALDSADITRDLAKAAFDRLKLDSRSALEFSDRVDDAHLRFGEEIQTLVTETEGSFALRAVEPTSFIGSPKTGNPFDTEQQAHASVAGSPESVKSSDIEQTELEPTSVEKRESMKAYMIDMSEVVKAYAWREAERRLRDVLDTKNFIKKGWVRMGEKGYLIQFYKEALEAIEGNRNLMAELESKVRKRAARLSEDGVERSNEVLDSVVDEYIQKIANEEEKGEMVNDPGVNLAVAELFSKFSTSEMSREEFEEQVRQHVAPMLKGRRFSGNAVDEGEQGRKERGFNEKNLYANNLYELAKGYKSELDKKITEHDPDQKENVIKALEGQFSLDLQLGRKERDLYETKPASNLKLYEKLADFSEKNRALGWFFANPVAYGIIGGQMGKWAGKAGLTVGLASIAGIAPWAIPLIIAGAMGGTYAGMRRSRDLQYDRGMDLRRQTLGAGSGGKRTDKIREFSYDQKSAEDLTAGLRGLLNNPDLGDEGKQLIAEVVARTQVEHERQVDLIGVKGEEGERYKTKLIAMKELRLAMRDVNGQFSVKNEDIQGYIDAHRERFQNDIVSNDKAFKSFKFKESVKAGIVGAAFGAVAGAIGQEVFNQGQELAGAHPKTDSLLAYLSGEKHLVPATGIKVVSVGDHFSIVGGDGKAIAEHVTIGPKGMDQATQDLLTSKGIHLTQTLGTPTSVDPIQTPGIPKSGIDVTQTMGAPKSIDLTETPGTPKGAIEGLKEFFGDKMGSHPRAGWFDNDGKSGYSFSLGQEKDGSVAINASGLLKNLIDNAKEAAGVNPDGTDAGKLGGLAEKLAQWSKDGTMHEHIQVAIIPTDEANKEGASLLLAAAGADGKIKLPDVLSKMFTNPENFRDGHLPFKFMEVRIDGHVLATASGESMHDFVAAPQIAPVPAGVGNVSEVVTSPKIPPTIAGGGKIQEIMTAPKFAFATEKPWDTPPVVPMFGRKQLERKAKMSYQTSRQRTVPPTSPVPDNIVNPTNAPEPGTSAKQPDTPEQTQSEPTKEPITLTVDQIAKYLGLTSDEYGKLIGKGKETLTTEELIAMTEKVVVALGITTVGRQLAAIKAGDRNETKRYLLFARMQEKGSDEDNEMSETTKETISVLDSLLKNRFAETTATPAGNVPDPAAQVTPIVPTPEPPKQQPEPTPETDADRDKRNIAEAVRKALDLTEDEYKQSVKVRRKKTVLASGQVMTREEVSGIMIRIAEHLKIPVSNGTDAYSELLRSGDPAELAVLKTVNGLISEMKQRAENDISDDKAKDQARKLLANIQTIWKETLPMDPGAGTLPQSPEPGTTQGLRDNLVETDPVRAMALHTIYLLEHTPGLTYDNLNAKDKKTADRKFIKLTRDLWTEFTTHETPDMDAYGALNIMKLAGMKHLDLDKVNFVKQSDYARSGSTVDSGNMNATTAGEGGKWIVDDHHARDSKRGTSATKFVYDSRVKFGLLKKTKYLDKFVEFITKCDNADFSHEERENILNNYDRSLYGLGFRMKTEDILKLFKDGVDPNEPLSDDYLKTHQYFNQNTDKFEPLSKLSEFVRNQMRNGKSELPGVIKAGFEFDTGKDRFGKILIDTGKRNAKGGSFSRISGANNSNQFQVFEKGYGAYLIWPSGSDSFVLYTQKKMDEESLPGGFSQGFPVRGHMWMKSKNDTSPRTITLDDVLAKLSGEKKGVADAPKLERALLIDTKSKEMLALFDEGTLTEDILRDTAGSSKIVLHELLADMMNQRNVLSGNYDKKIRATDTTQLSKKGTRDRIAIGVLLSSMKKPSATGITHDVQVPAAVSAVSPVSEPRKLVPEKKVEVESEEDRDRRVAIQDVLGVTEQEYKTFFKRNRQSMKHDEVADVIARIADTLGDLNQRRDTGDYATFLKEEDVEQQRATKLYNEMRKRVRSAITEATTQRSALNLLENAFMKWKESASTVSKQRLSNAPEPTSPSQPQSVDTPVPTTSEPLPPSAPAPETEPEPIAPKVESIDLAGLGIPKQFGKFELTRDSMEKAAKQGKVTVGELATAFVDSSPELKQKFNEGLKQLPGDNRGSDIVANLALGIIFDTELAILKKNLAKMETEIAGQPDGKKKEKWNANVEKLKVKINTIAEDWLKTLVF
ncbi:MAG: hypothetical protein WCL23_03090 [Candidatus Moraniibacteriota bacterium]